MDNSLLTYPCLSVRDDHFVIFNKYYGVRQYSEKTLNQNLYSNTNLKKEFDNLLNVKDEICFESWLNACSSVTKKIVNDLRANNIDKKEFGTISKNTVKEYKKRIELFVNALKFSRKKKTEFYLTFVTLTLPAKQMHTDNVLKKCLNRFIDLIKKSKDVKNYVWKAEAQKNGNIHFHILIDRFINHEYIKKSWNNIIGKLGYISKYAENMRTNGFKYVKGLNKSFQKQLDYYNEQRKDGFNNPNSTDIHSLRNINNPAKYIIKYMVKLEKEKRPIYGNIIRSSSTLSELKYMQIDGDLNMIEQIEKDFEKTKIELENCTIVKTNTYKYFNKVSKKYKNQLTQYYKTLYDKLFRISEINVQGFTKPIECVEVDKPEVYEGNKTRISNQISFIFPF